MLCNDNKFILNKNMSNEFIITIKANLSTLPMEIKTGDTFVATLFELESGLPVPMTITVSVASAIGGKIKLTFVTEEVNSLVSERGDKVDKYYLVPTYRLAIDCDTEINGVFVAKLPEVYVE